MRIVSVFDGMACGYIAMLRSQINISRYIAYEIDKYAVRTSSHNFPNIEHKGDVFEADFSEYKGFDFLLGGSPCTYWSIARTAKDREVVASGMGWELFSQYVRALKEVEPKYFIYENNKSMSTAIKQSISETFGFEPICINSALVSAQNRQRLYWVGIRQSDGTYKKADIQQPEDRGILLKYIIEHGLGSTKEDKSFALTNNYSKDPQIYGDYVAHNLEKNVKTMAAEPLPYLTEDNVKCLMRPFGSKGKIVSDDDKSHSLLANSGGGNLVYYAEEIKPLSEKEMEYMVRDTKGFKGDNWNFCNKPNQEDKSMCLLANLHKGVPYNVVAEPINATETGKSIALKSQYYKDNISNFVVHADAYGYKSTGVAVPVSIEIGGKSIKVYEVKDGMITVKGEQYPIKLKDGIYLIRKLTISECKRLQTVPDWYEFPVSNTQAYKMLGNGWTIEVISWLINSVMKGENEC